MPSDLIKAAAKKHNISVDKAEKTWKKAKAAAADQGHKEDYAYINGVFQKMLGESIIPMELIMARHEMQSDAWYLGYDAGQHKGSKEDNPYNHGSLSYKQWEQGFEVGTPDPELDEGVNKVNLKELIKDQNDYAVEVWGQTILDLYNNTDQDTIRHIEGLMDALKAGEILSYSEDDLKWMEDPNGGYVTVSNGEYSESNLATIAVDLLGIYNDVGTVSVEDNELDEAHVAELGVDVDPDKWYVVSGANTMHGGVENAFDSEAAAMNWATTQPNIDLADDDAVISGKDLIEIYALNEDTEMATELDNVVFSDFGDADSDEVPMEEAVSVDKFNKWRDEVLASHPDAVFFGDEKSGFVAKVDDKVVSALGEAKKKFHSFKFIDERGMDAFAGKVRDTFDAKMLVQDLEEWIQNNWFDDGSSIYIDGNEMEPEEALNFARNLYNEFKNLGEAKNNAWYIVDKETREYIEGPFDTEAAAQEELNNATVDNADMFVVTQYTGFTTEAVGGELELEPVVAPIGNFVVDKVLDMNNGVALVQFVEGTSEQGDYAVVAIGNDMITSGLPLPSLANAISFHGSFNDALESYQNKLAEIDKMAGDVMTPELLPIELEINELPLEENKFALIDLAKKHFGDIKMQPTVANSRKYISIKPSQEPTVGALTNFEAELKELGKSVTYDHNTKEIQVESYQLSPFERAGLKVTYSEDGKKAFIKIFTEQEMVKFNKTLENFANSDAIGEVKYKVSDSDENALYEIEVEMLQYANPNPNPEQAMKEMPVSK